MGWGEAELEKASFGSLSISLEASTVVIVPPFCSKSLANARTSSWPSNACAAAWVSADCLIKTRFQFLVSLSFLMKGRRDLRLAQDLDDFWLAGTIEEARVFLRSNDQ